jgi:glycosyltransferase involved in cell wall biosynthesis
MQQSDSERVLISIIIPCYNHGAFIREAIESVESNAKEFSYEIIINNDGSSDNATINELEKCQEEGYRILHQPNQGLAAARNNAISIAKGKYILPLDSDNKLHKNYLTKAIEILENNSGIDVVYGNPLFFGMQNGIIKVGEFDFFKIIRGNYIDACAVYKKEIWQKINGYDGNMPAMGHEDWEFWINIFINGGKFFYLDEVCFYYRSLPNSMAKTISTPSENLNRTYIYQKHCSKIIAILLQEKSKIDSKMDAIKKYLQLHKFKSIAKILFNREILTVLIASMMFLIACFSS